MKNLLPYLLLVLLSACGAEDNPLSDNNRSSVPASSPPVSESSSSNSEAQSSSTAVNSSSEAVVSSSTSTLSSAPTVSSSSLSTVSSLSSSSLSSTPTGTPSSSAPAVVSSSSSAPAISSSQSSSPPSSSSLSSSVSSSSEASSSSSSSSLSSAPASSSSSSSSSSLPASSSSSSSSSSIAALTAPTNVSVQTGSGSVTLNWNSVPGATGYNVFYATVPYLESANIGAYAGNNMRLDVTSPVTLTGLTNGTTYYFVVTAINDSNEGPDSQSVSATPLSSAMANNPTAQEVLLVELINRARFDPEAEASRYGISLNQGLAPGTISAIQKPPIAHNALLMRASRDHSQWMLNTRTFSHTGEGASTPTQRITAAGYTLSGSWTTGENISARGTSSSSINLTTQTPLQHRGLFESPGHRVNILNANYREVGIGQKKGAFLFPPNTGEYLTSMITQKFARSGSNYFVTGVIYNDSNDNNFYDVGEGLGGINISITGGSNATTNSAGAYSVARGNGTYTVTINGLAQPVSEEIIVSGSNIKFDVIVSGDDVSINTW